MDYTNERYVRLYTRDTTNWASLSWKAQGLLALIFRKLDRAGVLELGHRGKKGLTAHIGGGAAWPEMEPLLEELLEEPDPPLRFHQNGTSSWLTAPNFVEAQEAPQSNRQRQAECRARRRDLANAGDVLRSVTTVSHASLDRSRNATPEDRGVTPRHSDPSDPSDPSDLAKPTLVAKATKSKVKKPRPQAVPVPFTVAEMLAALEQSSRGKFLAESFEDRLAKPLTDVIRAVDAKGWGLAEVRLAGRVIAGWNGEARASAAWVAKAGNLVGAIARAKNMGFGAEARPAPSERRFEPEPSRPEPTPAELRETADKLDREADKLPSRDVAATTRRIAQNMRDQAAELERAGGQT